MYSGGIRTNSSRPCAPADTSKHYITLIVFVKSWGFPPLQAHLTRARCYTSVRVTLPSFTYY